jgi:hypothetical protein
VLLGGNQADTIKFSTHHIEAVAARTETVNGKKLTIAAKPDHLMFFVPADYAATAQTDAEVLGDKAADALNVEFGVTAAKPGPGRESTR